MIGLSACGDQELGGRTIVDFIRSFELDEIKTEDSVKDVANKLCKYAKGKYSGIVVFYICGYHIGIKNVIEIVNEKVNVRVDENNPDECYVEWRAEGHLKSTDR